MTPDDPRHGSYAGWQAHIKTGATVCEPCAEARREYQRERSYDRRLGNPRRVDPTPVRAHLRWLVTNGMTLQHIAEVSGVHAHTVEQIWQGARKMASADHSAWILAVPLAADPDGLVPTLGSARRLRALARLGWSADSIAEAAVAHGHRLEASALKSIRSERRAMVRTRTADAIAAAYGELSMRLPQFGRGVNSLRTRAERAGWAPPLAWDDDTIDDPATRPHGGSEESRRKTEIDPVAIERAMAGDHMDLTRAERFAVVARLRADGWSLKRIEAHTGMTKAERYIEREEVAS